MYKDLLSLLGVMIALVGSLPYILSILNGKAKPHFVTWLIWTVLATTGTALQIIGGGGWGSAILGFTALLNAIILCLSLKYIKNEVNKLDILILIFAGFSFIAWRLSKNPNVAEVLITMAFSLGYIPTYIKGYKRPETEKVSLYLWSAIKQVVGILALSKYDLLTLLLPCVLAIESVGLVGMLKAKEIKVYQSNHS